MSINQAFLLFSFDDDDETEEDVDSADHLKVKLSFKDRKKISTVPLEAGELVHRSDVSAGRPEVAVEASEVKAKSQLKKPRLETEDRKSFSNFCDKKVVGIVEPRVVIKPPTSETKNLDHSCVEETTQLIRELPKTFKEALLEKGAAELVEMSSEEFCSKNSLEVKTDSGRASGFRVGTSETKMFSEQHLTDRVSGPEVSTNKRKRDDGDRRNLSCEGLHSEKCFCSDRKNGSDDFDHNKETKLECFSVDGRSRLQRTDLVSSCDIDNVYPECTKSHDVRSHHGGQGGDNFNGGGSLSKSDARSIRNQKRSDSESQHESAEDNGALCRRRQRRRRRCRCQRSCRCCRCDLSGENSIKILSPSKEKVAENQDEEVKNRSDKKVDIKDGCNGCEESWKSASGHERRFKLTRMKGKDRDESEMKGICNQDEMEEDEIGAERIIPTPSSHSSTLKSNCLEVVVGKKNNLQQTLNKDDQEVEQFKLERKRKRIQSLSSEASNLDGSSESDDDEDDEDEDLGRHPFLNLSPKASFSLSMVDDRWMYCQERGCSFWTRKPDRMDRHSKCHLPDQKHYQCPDCPLRFYSLAKMLKHDRKVHTGVKDYECRVCDAEVTDIQIHMRVSHRKTKMSTILFAIAPFVTFFNHL